MAEIGGVEEMGIANKTLPSLAIKLGFSRAQPLAFGPDTRSYIAVQALRRVAATGSEDETLARKHSDSVFKERILALYDEYRPRLFRYIRSMNLSQDQAEEVVQETFLRLTTQLMQENNIENVQGWIVRVAHNFAVDLLKRNDRDYAGKSDNTLVLERCVDPTPNPEEAYFKKERIKRMQTALSTLNPQHRQCFDLRVRGFRYKDIGITFGISEQRAAFIVKQVTVRLASICG